MYLTQNIGAKERGRGGGSCEKPTCDCRSLSTLWEEWESCRLKATKQNKQTTKKQNKQNPKNSRRPYPGSNELSGGISGGCMLMEMHSDARLVGLQRDRKGNWSSQHC